MSAPQAIATGLSGDPHRRLRYEGLYFRFNNESKPRIQFTEAEITIGCKTITRDAFEELYRRYQEFLRNRVHIVQEAE